MPLREVARGSGTVLFFAFREVARGSGAVHFVALREVARRSREGGSFVGSGIAVCVLVIHVRLLILAPGGLCERASLVRGPPAHRWATCPAGIDHWRTPVYVAAMFAAIAICSVPTFVIEQVKKPSWNIADPDDVLDVNDAPPGLPVPAKAGA